MADLADVVQNCHMNFHSFVDDLQIYLHCQLSGVPSAVRKLEDCISEVGHWMSANLFKLNTDKTELLWVGSRHKLATFGSCTPSLQLGINVIRASDHVRLLGVIIAADLSLDRHVSTVCKTCFFWLRQLRRVRHSLDTESLKILVHAFVTSRVDYCNSVLASAPKITDELQRALNAAAHLICTSKYERGMSALLHDKLHCLGEQIGHPPVSAVQACCNRPPVSLESSTDVPHQQLRSSVRRCWSPAPAIRQPLSTDCSKCPLQHLWLLLLCFCWSYSLEFTA